MFDKKALDQLSEAGIIYWAVGEDRHGRGEREMFLRLYGDLHTAIINPKGWVNHRYFYEYGGHENRFPEERQIHQSDEDYILEEVSRLLSGLMTGMSAHARMDLINHAGFYKR